MQQGLLLNPLDSISMSLSLVRVRPPLVVITSEGRNLVCGLRNQRPRLNARCVMWNGRRKFIRP